MSEVEIITTADGSHSLRNKTLNETYHSSHGALQESLHVFIQSGLQYFIDNRNSRHVTVFEVGFGTGLNALLALQFSEQQNISIRYITIEAFPLAEAVWSQLNFPSLIKKQQNFETLHRANWNEEQPVTSNFSILKMQVSLQQFNAQPGSVDVVFFDAFAPNKQPELWEKHLLLKVVEMLKPGSVFVTYCAKGQVRRDLQSLGLTMQKLEGPPGKKEMLRGLVPAANISANF